MKTEVRDQRPEISGRGSVLECGGPPPLFPAADLVCPAQSARGLAHSKTWRPIQALVQSALFFSDLPTGHELGKTALRRHPAIWAERQLGPTRFLQSGNGLMRVPGL
jgi:hypothetical protein